MKEKTNSVYCLYEINIKSYVASKANDNNEFQECEGQWSRPV